MTDAESYHSGKPSMDKQEILRTTGVEKKTISHSATRIVGNLVLEVGLLFAEGSEVLTLKGELPAQTPCPVTALHDLVAIATEISPETRPVFVARNPGETVWSALQIRS